MSGFSNFVDEAGVTRLRAKGGGSQPGASRWLGPCKINAFTVQTIGGTAATAGTFTLAVNSETTAALAFDAAPSAVVAALEALPSIGAGNVVAVDPSGNISDTGVTLQFDDVIATEFLTADVTDLIFNGEPYPDPFAITSGDPNGNIVVEMFTPAVGDVIEDFMHAVVTAFDAADELTYTDDPTDPDANGPMWANPSSAQGVGGIDVMSSDDSFTNFYGNNGADFRQQPSSLTALIGAWAQNAAAETPTAVVYGNLPNVVKNAVPVYSVIQGVFSATQGEVWIWVKTATPAPLMD